MAKLPDYIPSQNDFHIPTEQRHRKHGLSVGDSVSLFVAECTGRWKIKQHKRAETTLYLEFIVGKTLFFKWPIIEWVHENAIFTVHDEGLTLNIFEEKEYINDCGENR